MAHQPWLDPLELHDEDEGDLAADVVDAGDVVDEEAGVHALHTLELRAVVRAVAGRQAERRRRRLRAAAVGILR